MTVTAEVAALGLSETSSEGDHENSGSSNGSNGNNGGGGHAGSEPQAVEALRREVAQLRLRLELLESQVS